MIKIESQKWAILVVAIAAIIISFSLHLWREESRVIEHDVRIYYGYLPAGIIFHDITLKNGNYSDGTKGLFWTVQLEDGHSVFKMSSGLAILYLPFFLAAHLYALSSDYLSNGFSEPYKYFLIISAVFYLIIGLDFLRKTLQLLNFSKFNIVITILMIGLSTNLLCYASQSSPMSHVYNFALFSIFIYYSLLSDCNPKLKYIIIMGITYGLITLIRPSNGLIILFPVLLNVKSVFEIFKKKYNIYHLLLFTGLILLCWVPQLLYWKFSTGKILAYSYTDERFFFNDPMIFKGLFSFRKGWLIYTPVMIFSLLGMFFLRKERKYVRNSIVIFTILNIYVIFSWWCWWYGGTYGQRAMIDSYALLAIPIAAFNEYIFNRKLFVKAGYVIILVFFTWLNIFQTYQFEYHSLHWDGMSLKLYLKQFGKIDKVENYDAMIRWPNYDDAKKGIR